MTYTILSEKFEDTDKYLRKMCKKLTSIGIKHEYSHSEPYDVNHTIKATQPYEQDQIITLNVVDINFWAEDIYLIRGYRIIAVIDHGENGNLVFLQGVTLQPHELAVLQRLQPNCMHCNTKRKRKKTVVLVHEQTNWLIQVGLSCLDGYLGVNISGKLECLTDLEKMLEDMENALTDTECMRMISTGDYISPTELLAHLVHARNVLYPNQKYVNYKDLVYRYVREPTGAPTNEEIKHAIKIQKYIMGLELTDNAFDNNLITLCRSNYIRNRYVRILVWAIAKYDDYIRKIDAQKKKEEAAAARKEAWKDSSYYGEVGQKLGEIELTCLRLLYTKETSYGYNNTAYTYVYSLTDGKNEFIWSTSNWLKEGCKYKLKGGTVKEHKEFEGVPQTIITRCKIIDSDTDEYYKKQEETEQ